MREIKFRAWFHDPDSPTDGEMLDFETTFREGYVELAVESLKPVDECTILMQYTGLKDKNGVEIYEGDVVREVLWSQNQTNDVLGKVHWSDGNSGFWVSGRSVLTQGYTQDLEVIGNIYENPELLRGGDE